MKLSKFLNLKNLCEILTWVLKRFPVALIILCVFTWLLFALLHTAYNFEYKDILWKATFSSVIAFLLSVWSYIYTEEQKFSPLKKQVFQFFPVIFWILFFFGFSTNFNDIQNAVFFLLTLCWVFSLLFYAPFIKNIREKNTIFYSYFYRIAVMLLISVIFWWVLFWLWAVWITAVEELFDINFSIRQTPAEQLCPVGSCLRIPEIDRPQRFNALQMFEPGVGDLGSVEIQET